MRATVSGAGWYPGPREGSVYAWLERTKKANPIGEWTAGQLLRGLRGAKHAVFLHLWRLYYQIFLGKGPLNCATQRMKRQKKM